MLTNSKRMLNETSNKWSISSKYDTILIGDPYCGKSSYIKMLVSNEKELFQMPVLVSDDENEFEFWVGGKSKKAIFVVRDTANQERFRSLTQSYYRKAQCALLIFNLSNEESFLNLNKWHSDIMNYSKNQENNFSIVLVGLKNKPNSENKTLASNAIINLELVEQFQKEKEFIIGYSEINLFEKNNLKEPFEILLDHFSDSKLLANNLSLNIENFNNQLSMANPNYKKYSIISYSSSQNKFQKEFSQDSETNLIEHKKKSCCNLL